MNFPTSSPAIICASVKMVGFLGHVKGIRTTPESHITPSTHDAMESKGAAYYPSHWSLI